jgi:hypothetical protein
MDVEGGIWSASPSTDECLRQTEGGRVTHRVPVSQGAFACMLGGDTLHILTAPSSEPEVCEAEKRARVEVIKAPYPGAGWP